MPAHPRVSALAGSFLGAFARDALRPPRAYARARRCESRAHRATRKSHAPSMRTPGAKRRTGQPAKTQHHLNCKREIEMFFTHTFYNDAARRVATSSK